MSQDITPSKWREHGAFDAERAELATRYMRETGDHHVLVALRARIHPDDLVGWLLTGMRRDGPEPYRSWALGFLAAEAEYSARCLEAINAAIFHDGEPQLAESVRGFGENTAIVQELDPREAHAQRERQQKARNAQWVLKHRFGAFWGTRQTTSTAAEVVGLLLRREESERLERARKLLDRLPLEVKQTLHQLKFGT